MSTTMTYDRLYSNMVKTFTVEKDHVDYKLGEYMLMKAKGKKMEAQLIAKKAAEEAAKLPVKVDYRPDTTAIASVISFISDKLAVKEAPIVDKTMRSFPLRTSFTAFCSAAVVCALAVTCGIFGVNNTAKSEENMIKAEEHEQIVEESRSDIPEVAYCFE